MYIVDYTIDGISLIHIQNTRVKMYIFSKQMNKHRSLTVVFVCDIGRMDFSLQDLESACTKIICDHNIRSY